MKIDLHLHTRNTKGEDPARNIDAANLVDKLKKKGVEIAAITNHNLFNDKEFTKVVELSNNEIIFFPGVELDVTGKDDEHAHVIVVCNPYEYKKFEKLFGEKAIISPKSYVINLDELLASLNGLDYILIAHYQKKPELSKSSIEYIRTVIEDYRFFYEPKNFRGLSINSNKGMRCLIGSDVTNWDNYLKDNIVLPELKLRIASFSELVLLSKKDVRLVNTLLSKDKITSLEVPIVRDREKKPLRTEEIQLFDNLNVVFGGKGSGKSKYLEFIKNVLIGKGESPVYYNSDNAEDFIKDSLKPMETDFDFKLILKDTSDIDFSAIEEWEKYTPTALNLYFEAVKTNQNKRNRKYIKLIELDALNNSHVGRLKSIKQDYIKIINFQDWFLNNIDVGSLGVEKEEYNLFLKILKKYVTSILKEYKEIWIGNHSIKLTNKTLGILKEETDILSNGISIPTTAGLEDTFVNMIKPYLEINAYVDFSNQSSEFDDSEFGVLDESRKLYLRKHVTPYNDYITAKEYKFKKMTVSELKNINDCFNKTYNSFCTQEYFTNLSTLKDLVINHAIDSLNHFVCVSRRFTENENDFYNPSSGESKVVAFQRALISEANYYLLDEPEKSLGSYYTTTVILPELRKLASRGKCVVCTTHSANIAVLGMPSQTLYKEYSNREYLTYCGNMFINELICVSDKSKIVSWREKSLELLEGGEFAFSERGYAYGV